MRDKALQKAIKAAKGVRALARAIGIDHAAVSRWTHVPGERLFAVSRATGIPPEKLRPDLFKED